MTEREWREASDLRPSRVGLAAVLISAALLRFWSLGHGIPFALGVDEPEIMMRAVDMMRSGDLHPHFFDYPGLYIYLQFVASVARFIAGAVGGDWGSLAGAPTTEFYMWGRALTATFGVATVFIVFQIGMRWGARHALLAAGLMAVQPQHVRQSHYVLTDVPLTFFVALTLLLSLRANERGTFRAFAWAGVAAGLATATKYNGVIVLIVPLIACAMSPPLRSRLLTMLGIVGTAFVTFLAAAPYTIIDLPGFLNAFARLSEDYRTAAAPPEPPWLLYLKHLRNGFRYPALLLALAGTVLGLVRLARGPGRARWAMVIAFPLVYFWFVSGQRIVFARYLLPIMPSLCILAATAVISGVSLLRRYEVPRAPRTALIAGLTIAALLPPAWTAIGFNRSISRTGTAELAYDWVRKTIPKDAVIVIESRNLLLPDHRNATHVTQLRHRPLEYYVEQQVDYLIASSSSYGQYLNPQTVYHFRQEYTEYRTIFDQCQELARFTPSDANPGPEFIVFKVRR